MKNPQKREARKPPRQEFDVPTTDRDAERRRAMLRASDEAYRAYWLTLDPRQQALMPPP